MSFCPRHPVASATLVASPCADETFLLVVGIIAVLVWNVCYELLVACTFWRHVVVSLLGRLADGEFDEDVASARIAAIRNAQCEIARRCADVIDFRALAASLGVSYDAFRHNFTAKMGMSPLQFQLSERLRIAANLLANSDMPIQTIAEKTGFASAAYFTRFFKSATQMSPTEFRNAQPSSDAEDFK